MSDPKLELRLEVHIRARGQAMTVAYGDLHVSETIKLPVSGFAELCKILGQFHDLAHKIKTAA